MNRFCVKTIFPPNYLKNEIDQKKTIRLFLAGSIEQGKAEEWQKRIINFHYPLPIIFSSDISLGLKWFT